VVGCVCESARAQGQAVSGQARVNESRQVRLSGTVHALARAENDRGAVEDSFRAERMIVILKRPAEREAALQGFLREAHTAGRAGYHKWISPEEFGAKFGARDEDVQQVQSWLQAHGFAVTRLTKSRDYLEFSGTAAQVREALKTEIHQYEVDGKNYFSIAAEVSLPEEIAPLIKGFAPLNTFPLTSFVKEVGRATLSAGRKGVTADFTTTNGTKTIYPLAPEDFATQYNLGPLYQAGVDGTGKTIGIVGRANLDLSTVDAFRKLFGLAGNNTQVVIDGEDPGIGITPSVEGFLDVEVSGAVAPKAAVNYYIGGGTHFQDGLILATMRAIEDNQADVISVSYGECEQALGPMGNMMWAGFWEQAAAQGQTVLVSSGDSGPTVCPGLGQVLNGNVSFLGLNVNGLASTPWNVAVGGTDFYYADYATRGASIANLWNATNDANFGSLKAPLPEQPWDNPLGFNITPLSATNFGVPGAAGGGGASSCSQFTSPGGFLGNGSTCLSGYAKPVWQNAPGVPGDGVRDLPDVSLFAANGRNLTAYAICAEPSNCAAVPTGEPQVFLVGGTSASAPAMAGIMALVNQKYGRQGQANFTLYALARQQPSVFHDITTGTNDVLCFANAQDCTTPVTGLPPIFSTGPIAIESYGVYEAAPGYDLASGIGSVDANALVNNWNKITFLPTSTMLQISPASIVHGSPVSITTTVKAVSGTVVPGGDVNISTTSPQPLVKGNELTLNAGTATANWNYFPGGTYSVTANYAGDGTFATSSSAPSTLTVTAEPSATSLLLRYEYEDPSSQQLLFVGNVMNGGQVPFSSLLTFSAQPSGQRSQDTGDATGTATFTDGTTSVTVPMNAQGEATWSPQTLAMGAHSVSVSYSGDASYSASIAGPLAFTVGKGIPVASVGLETLPTAIVPSGGLGQGEYQAGSSVVAHVKIAALNSFVPPTGNVTITFGTLTQTVAVTPTAYSNQGLSAANVTFANVPAGTYSLSATYAGDSNWNTASFTSPSHFVFVAGTAATTTTTLTATPTSVDSAGSVKFAVTVSSTVPQPGGLAELSANGTIFAVIGLNSTSSGGALTNTGSVTVPGTALPSGTLQVIAIYTGSLGQGPSTSAPVQLNVNFNDFTMSTAAQRVVVKSGGSLGVPLLLGGPNGGGTTVSLACLPSATSFSCSLSPATQTLKGAGSAMMTVNAYVMQTSAAANVERGAWQLAWLTASGGFAFGFVFILALPKRKHFGGVLLCFGLMAVGTFAAGCGGGSSSGPPPPPPPVKLNAPAGTYSIVVTGVAGGVTHNSKVEVVVE
jgi:hypothetical protein